MSKISRDIFTKAGLQHRATLPMPSNDDNVFTVYGEDWCGYTSAARRLLEESRKKFNYISFKDNRPLRYDFAKKYAFGHSTIPIIFKGQIFVGGFEQLKQL